MGGITRRLFLDGTLRTTLLAGAAARLSILDLLAAPRRGRPGGPPSSGFDGELIEESYGIAHRLRDGTLEIPTLVPEGPLHDAIVLGGGISGLAAAWELRRGGLSDVLLYEKEEYLGGNSRKGHANGTDYTCATWSVVRPKDRFLTGLFQDLGVVTGFAPDGTPRIDPRVVGPGPDNNILIDGTWYYDPFYGDQAIEEIVGRMPLSAGDRRDEVEFRRDLNRWAERRGADGRPAFAVPIEEGSRDPAILALDRITMEEYARRRGWGPRTLALIDDFSTSTIGGLASQVSAYGFLSFNSLGQGGEDITLPGGNAWLAERLAERAGRENLRTGLTAVRVENARREVRVVLVDPKTERFSMRRARTVVVACQKHITGRMVPELAAGRGAYLDYRYGALLMGAASVRRTPVLRGAPLAWFNTVMGRLAQGFLVADYNSGAWRAGDPKRPNVLCVWAPLEGRATRTDLLTRPWAHWADRLGEDLEFMVPGVLRDVTRLDLYAWGHHMVVPYPGFLTGAARRALSLPLGRITFAHSDRHGMPSFELAARAGHDAAREALALVKR